MRYAHAGNRLGVNSTSNLNSKLEIYVNLPSALAAMTGIKSATSFSADRL